MVQLDPTSPYSESPVTASITFTNKIIGIALFGGPSLNASDIYGNPKTIYPTGLPNLFLQTRGIDYTHSDMLSISSNGNTLTLQLPANYGIFDQIRVFTAASGLRNRHPCLFGRQLAWFLRAGAVRAVGDAILLAAEEGRISVICEIWEKFAGRGLDGNCTSAYRAWRVLAMPQGYGAWLDV